MVCFCYILTTRGVCDNECLRFRQWLNGMPAEKPRAVIYYLVQKSTIHKLNISLRYLDSNFNDRSVHEHRNNSSRTVRYAGYVGEEIARQLEIRSVERGICPIHND